VRRILAQDIFVINYSIVKESGVLRRRQGADRIKLQDSLQATLHDDYLLPKTWVNIHAAKPIASNAVNIDATVAIKAILILSL